MATTHVTMVKKKLLNGSACAKCDQAEELLRRRGLWEKIDEVVVAAEGEPDSRGMQLSRQWGIEVAPFFIVRKDGSERAFKSVLQFIRETFPEPKHEPAATAPADVPEDLTGVAREFADRHPSEILTWALSRFGPACALAFSGAEDVALIHMAVKTGLPFSVFCLDTGRLHPETYRFIEQVRSHYGLEIALLSPDLVPLEALVRRKGLFSFYEDGHKECCGIRKVAPLRRALEGVRAWVTGQRHDQSPATRSEVPVIQEDDAFRGSGGDRLIKFNPLANWSSKQTWAYIRENEVPFNSLHEKGFVSIGCEPCTRPVHPGQHEREGRWWWELETQRECGLHVGR